MAKKFMMNEVPGGRPPAEIIAEIRALYFKATPRTIDTDLANAIALLKQIPEIEDRHRAHVYMEGLAEMRKEFGRKKRGGPR
jgi:hypothetical protein